MNCFCFNTWPDPDPYTDPRQGFLLYISWACKALGIIFTYGLYIEQVQKQFPWGIILIMGGGNIYGYNV